jgi:hypothetical protein
MIPHSSNSFSAATSMNGDLYATDRALFIDGVEHSFRDMELLATDFFLIAVRPPFRTGPEGPQELR